jgi:hypothetical protein
VWHQFWLWLWGEPPLTYWAVWLYWRMKQAEPIGQKKICKWRAIPVLGWKPSIKFQHSDCQAEAIIGPFPELADAQKFCDQMNAKEE